MLTRIQVEGVKSLAKVSADFTRFTVLVGPNGCGKSTLLDAIEILAESTQPDPERREWMGRAGATLRARGFDQLRTQGSDRAIRIEGTGTDGRTVRVGAPPPPADLLGSLEVTVDPGDGSPTIVRTPTGADGADAFEGHTARVPPWRTQRLALSPTRIARPSPSSVPTLNPDGEGLPTVLKDLAANHTEAYLQLQEDLRAVVPQFRSLRIGRSTNGGSQDTLTLVMQQGTIPAASASDGTLCALALLAATHDPDLAEIVLMDDLDHGLHLSAQYELIRAIRGVLGRRPELQIVCTSHSPFMLDEFEPDEVRVMALGADGYSRLRPLTALPDYERARIGLRAGELWASAGEEWVTQGG